MHRAHAIYRQSEVDEPALLAQYGQLVDRQARRIAHRVGNPDLIDDLWSVGALGLLDAAQRFDPAQGVRFETFVQHRIRGAMVDELRRLDHLPRRMRADVNRVTKAREAISRASGGPASDEAVAASLEIDLGTLARTEALALPPLPLLPELLAALKCGSAEDQLLELEAKRHLTRAIEGLPQRLQILLSLHYVEDLSYREIAEVLKVSQPRISQLHSEAIARLRAALTDPATGEAAPRGAA